MKVIVTKGPLFEKVVEDAQKVVYEFLVKTAIKEEKNN